MDPGKTGQRWARVVCPAPGSTAQQIRLPIAAHAARSQTTTGVSMLAHAGSSADSLCRAEVDDPTTAHLAHASPAMVSPRLALGCALVALFVGPVAACGNGDITHADGDGSA